MEPIVSPMFIYLLYVVDKLKMACTVPLIVLALLLLIFGMGVGFEELSLDECKSWFKKLKLKIAIIIGVICVLLIVIVPDSKTMLTMYVASQLTYNKINQVVDAGKDIKETLKKDIIDIIQAVQEKESK